MERSQFDMLGMAYEKTWTLPFRHELEAHTFFKHLGNVEGKNILDVGSGSGLYTREIRRRGAARVVGLDISPEMVKFAAGREREEPLGIHYVNSDMADAGKLGLGQFDIVTGVYVLFYASTREHFFATIQGISDVLPPGGRLVSMPLNPNLRMDDPDYYMPYSMGIWAPGETGEGCPVILNAKLEGVDFTVTMYRWSRETHEEAFKAAGFKKLTWYEPEVTPKGIELMGEEYWQRYLKQPHALLIEAEK